MPKLSKELLSQLNAQIGNELYASHLYLAMAAYFDDTDLPGFAKWIKIQAAEERAHAFRFYDHIVQRGSRVQLGAIEEPPIEYKGPADAFAKALQHEQNVTKQIYELYEAAEAEHDHALEIFLHGFITEQIEEERTIESILDKIRKVQDQPLGILMLDKDLGAREA